MKPNTEPKQMSRMDFMKLLRDNPGAIAMLTEIISLAKNDGYSTGFDAGYEAGAAGNVYSYDGE